MRSPFERFKDSITVDNLWLYILLLLKKRDMYPYEVRDEIEKQFGFKPGNMTAYIVLKRLSNEKYIKISKVIKEKGPERNYYSITEKGKKELQKTKALYKQIGNILL